MNQSAVTTTPVSDGVGQALEISLRGVEELLPRDEWVKKLTRSEASGQPLRIKLGLDPTAPDNLEVPPHMYLSDTKLIIGEDKA